MSDTPTSLSLLDRVRDRDQEAWQRLIYMYAPLVRFWCRRWGVDPSDVDDLQQEIFLAVSVGLVSFRKVEPGDTFRGWLKVIAYRKFLDHCRARKRQPPAASTEEVPRDLCAPGNVGAQEDDPPDEVRRVHHRALELVRGEFEERTWLAFWKCAVEGGTPDEISQEMRMTPAAVRKAKSRVLRRLKEELGDFLG